MSKERGDYYIIKTYGLSIKALYIKTKTIFSMNNNKN